MKQVRPLIAVETAQSFFPPGAKRHLPLETNSQTHTFVCAPQSEFSRERRRTEVGMASVDSWRNEDAGFKGLWETVCVL